MTITYQYRDRANGVYPVTTAQILATHGSRVTLGAAGFTPDIADALGYDTVQVPAIPLYNTDTQAIEAVAPQIINGEWVQSWVVRDLTAAERSTALAQAVAQKVAEADRIARDKRDAVVATVSPAEMASWPIKRAEALAYQASHLPTDAPNLQAEATARGVTLDVLVGKVLGKAAQLAALEAGIAGRCGAIQDAAKACAEPSLVQAIDAYHGWPV